MDEELPDVRLVEFRNPAAALAVDLKRGSRLERLGQQVFSGGTRILSDVGEGILKHLAGLLGPDYTPAPRSHFRRMALSTSS